MPVASAAPVWSVDGLAPQGFDDAGRRARLSSVLPGLDAYLTRLPAEKQLPALAVGVVLDGELVHSFGAGRQRDGASIDADSVFRIGSITKTFTSAAVLKQRDEGRLSLDDPAERYMPELRELVYPSRDARPFTVRDLLTHSSGLPRLGDFNATPTDHDVVEDEVLASLPGFALVNAPGTQRVYSNLGFSLLGLIVGRTSHARFRDYVSQQILAPLGMTSTSWDPPAHKLAQGYAGPSRTPVAPWRLGAGEASGGLFSSVRDLARYASFELSAWPARNDEDGGPIRRASLRESHAMSVFGSTVSKRLGDQAVAVSTTRGGGLGWQIAEDSELGRVVWHNGTVDGYSSALYMLPERGLAVVALCNVSGADMDSVADDTLRMLVRGAQLPERQLQASAALVQGASRVTALIAGEGTDELERSFYGSPSELPALRNKVTEVRNRFGTCAKARAVQIESGVAGTFALECERGEVQVKLKVRTGKFAGLVSVQVDDSAQPMTAGRVASRQAAP